MTPGDIDWPPPVCGACRDGFCEDCPLTHGCECWCDWIYQEDVWPISATAIPTSARACKP